MQLSSILFMLAGAAIFALGTLTSALADRIRGIKLVRDPQPRERTSRTPSAPAVAASLPVIEYAKPIPVAAPTPKPTRAPSKPAAPDGGEDVIAALVASGYKKPIATEAAWACTAAERATAEAWVAAALRKCARGVS
jgi:hypothetical protein